jgi:hypothetical protein
MIHPNMLDKLLAAVVNAGAWLFATIPWADDVAVICAAFCSVCTGLYFLAGAINRFIEGRLSRRVAEREKQDQRDEGNDCQQDG